MNTIQISNARPTTYDVKDGVDVDVSALGLQGEATVCPDPINGGWQAYGDSLDMWLSGALAAEVAKLDAFERRELLGEIVEQAGKLAAKI